MNLGSLEKLIKTLNKDLGIAQKQARKIAYNLIGDFEIQQKLIDDLDSIKQVQKCQLCNNVTTSEICKICSDKSRSNVLVVVETPLDILKFEDININFHPQYYVLGQLIKVKEKKGEIEYQNFFNQDHFLKRILNFNEIILALSPNIDGLVTSNFLKSIIETESKIKITQLAQGIPLGAALEYVDKITLKEAINNRRKLD